LPLVKAQAAASLLMAITVTAHLRRQKAAACDSWEHLHWLKFPGKNKKNHPYRWLFNHIWLLL